MLPSDFAKYGDEPELIVEWVRGTRTFKVNDAGWLTGLYYKQAWVPGTNYAVNYVPAATRPDEYGNWPAWLPKPGITHPDGSTHYDPNLYGSYAVSTLKTIRQGSWGFYAYNEGSDNYRSSGPVHAVVEGSGLMLTGTRGFRASKARIVALTLDPKLSPLLSAKVCVNYPDVTLYPTFEIMVNELPPDHFEGDDQ